MPTPENRAPIGFTEFVTLIAALMALTALSIDSMLSALPVMSADLRVAIPNQRQLVVTTFMIGFGLGQLLYGPLADRFGRRPVLGISLSLGVIATIAGALATSFPLLLATRTLAGIALAGPRVISLTLVRDCFSGRAMARVMSIAFVMLVIVPVIAPSLGALVLLFASWRWIFGGIAGVAALILLWCRVRMPETLHPQARNRLNLVRICADCRTVLGNRSALGYTIAACCINGGLFGFLNSIQQIVYDTLHAPHLLTPIFACVSGMMALGSFANARLVMRAGMRPIAHIALTAIAVLAAAHLALALLGLESVVSFLLLQALLMLCLPFCLANFSAIAMEDMAAVAGTAASLQGFLTTLAGALIGAITGQAFDGTTAPLHSGFLLTALVALGTIAITERGRLYRSHGARPLQ